MTKAAPTRPRRFRTTCECGRRCASAPCCYCRGAQARVTEPTEYDRLKAPRVEAYRRWYERHPNRPLDCDRALSEYLSEVCHAA